MLSAYHNLYAIKWQEMDWEDDSTLSGDETDSQMGYVSVSYYVSSGNRSGTVHRHCIENCRLV